MYSFPYLEPVCCSTSSSNCCFLTCIQISQEAGQVVWYSYVFQNSPQFVVIHTVKGFGIVNKAEIDVFLELSCFFGDPATLLKCWLCDMWLGIVIENWAFSDDWCWFWAFQFLEHLVNLLRILLRSLCRVSESCTGSDWPAVDHQTMTMITEVISF